MPIDVVNLPLSDHHHRHWRVGKPIRAETYASVLHAMLWVLLAANGASVAEEHLEAA